MGLLSRPMCHPSRCSWLSTRIKWTDEIGRRRRVAVARHNSLSGRRSSTAEQLFCKQTRPEFDLSPSRCLEYEPASPVSLMRAYLLYKLLYEKPAPLWHGRLPRVVRGR